jgi:hypothetical protein
MPFWINAQKNKPAHRQMEAEHEFSKIFVLCEQQPVFVIRSPQDLRVCHSRGEFRHVDDVVSGAAEPTHELGV